MLVPVGQKFAIRMTKVRTARIYPHESRKSRFFEYRGPIDKTLIERITSAFWDNPQALIDPPPDPGISDEVFALDNEAKTLTLVPRTYLGTMLVTVTATDSALTTVDKFEFETYL